MDIDAVIADNRARAHYAKAIAATAGQKGSSLETRFHLLLKVVQLQQDAIESLNRTVDRLDRDSRDALGAAHV